MATYTLRMNLLQKIFLLTMSFLMVGCISSQPFPQGVAEVQPQPIPKVRAPKVGQEWVYQIRNVFNQDIVDIVTGEGSLGWRRNPYCSYRC